MPDLNMHIWILFVPLILTNVLHMVIVKRNLFSALAIPISAKHFGQNKTWRGLLFLPITNACFTGLMEMVFGPFTPLSSRAFFLGFLLGLAYVLAELPNSFVKRRLGIAPGGSAEKHKMLQTIIDKTDSLILVFLTYYLFLNVSLADVLTLFFAALIIHLTISRLLVAFKIKKSL